MIRLENLSKSYPQFKLENISLTVEPGSILTLLGESGCGKTTLLKIIAGLIPRDGGKLFIGGNEAAGLSAKEKGLAMVFQSPLLLPHLNVRDNIALGLKIQGVAKGERFARASEALGEVHLSGFELRHPRELSGGQQQRVSLARALVMNPKILLMDEPFSALDENLRVQMQKLLKEIQRRHGSTVVFVTHDRDEAFALSDKIALLREGRLLQEGSPEEIYARPRSATVARFLGIKNVFELRGSLLEVFPMEPPSLQPLWIGLRSEDLSLSLPKGAAQAKGLCHWQGYFREKVFKRGFYEAEVEVDGGLIFEVAAHRFPEGLSPGDRVELSCRKEDIILIPKF